MLCILKHVTASAIEGSRTKIESLKLGWKVQRIGSIYILKICFIFTVIALWHTSSLTAFKALMMDLKIYSLFNTCHLRPSIVDINICPRVSITIQRVQSDTNMNQLLNLKTPKSYYIRIWICRPPSWFLGISRIFVAAAFQRYKFGTFKELPTLHWGDPTFTSCKARSKICASLWSWGQHVKTWPVNPGPPMTHVRYPPWEIKPILKALFVMGVPYWHGNRMTGYYVWIQWVSHGDDMVIPSWEPFHMSPPSRHFSVAGI